MDCLIFSYTFNIVFGGKGGGGSGSIQETNGSIQKIEKHSAKCKMFQVILAVIVDLDSFC